MYRKASSWLRPPLRPQVLPVFIQKVLKNIQQILHPKQEVIIGRAGSGRKHVGKVDQFESHVISQLTADDRRLLLLIDTTNYVIVVDKEQRAGVEVVAALPITEELDHLGEKAVEMFGNGEFGGSAHVDSRLLLVPVEEVVEQVGHLHRGQVQTECLKVFRGLTILMIEQIPM